MISKRRTILTFAFSLAALSMGAAAQAADTTIHVSLWDKGPDSVMMDEQHQMAMGMKGADMMMALLGITVDTETVPAGTVTFEVTNDSKDIIHEMVVSSIPSADTVLPYSADMNKVDEDAAGHLGEVAELDPGKSGTLTVDMTPGLYVLYCNIPGHFMGGMWKVLTVTP